MTLPPLADVLHQILHVVLPALLTAATVGYVLPAFLGRRAGYAAAALAMVAGLAVGNHVRPIFTLRTSADVPWTTVVQDLGRRVVMGARAQSDDPAPPAGRSWLPWAALLATLAGLAARAPRVPLGLGWLVRLAAIALATRLVIPLDMTAERPWLPWAFAAVVLMSWWVIERLSVLRTDSERASALPAAATSLACVAAAGVLLHAHSALLMDAATMLSASLAGVALAAALGQADAGGAAPVAAVCLPGVMLAGQYETYSEVPALAFVLVAVAPLALAVLVAPRLQGIVGWRRWALGLGVVLMLVTIAMVLAARAESLEFG